jgi:hypothetical protein
MLKEVDNLRRVALAVIETKIIPPQILDHATFDGVPDVLLGQITATQI